MGTAACTGGQPGPCLPGPRDCSSDIDNDCNGVVDRLETTCVCVLGTTRSCGTAACTGAETCLLSPDRGSTRFSVCALTSETMPDPALVALVRSRLGLVAGQSVTLAALADLVSVSSTGSGMTRLDGIQCLTRLTGVAFSERISDGSPLAGLPALTFLELQNNLLTDVSWLRSMPQLGGVRIGSNAITDVSVLRSLPRLRDVDISNNPIADLSVLSDLPTLARLNVSGLGLTNLTLLSGQTGVSGPTGVTETSVRFLDLSNNPLTDISVLDSFPSLQELSLLGTGLSCDLPIMASLAARLSVFNSDCPNL